MKSVANSGVNTAVCHPFQNIPLELRALNQWVCWRYEDRNGKPTKPPIDAKSNGKLLKAKNNDPATWADFETAVVAAVRLNLEGVGLNFWESDGLTGLDLDHVFDPATGELDPLAREVLARFAGTYAEISPSGAGLRVWCYGKPGRSGKIGGKRKWLEVYSHPSHRYLTATGNHWPGSSDHVTEQQDALDWLHSRFMSKSKDESTGQDKGVSQGKGKPLPPSVESSLDLDDAALLDKARSAKNGAIFEALWSGDLSGYGGDHSGADLALLNALAFWTGSDAARMDRLFRQSGLMRDKWDVVHDPATGRTYGAMSIDKAIAGCREGYSGKRPGKGQEKAKATQARAAGVEPIDTGDSHLWRTELMRRQDSDQPLKNHYNAVLVAENALPGLIGYNEFRQRIEKRINPPWGGGPGQWTERDTGELACYVAKPFASFTLDLLGGAIMVAAHRHRFNPGQDRLRALAEQWDGVPRIDSWLVDYLSAKVNSSNSDYLREMGACWIKGVAARVLKPGCKRDDVLVLRGDQGWKKSTAARIIADAIAPDAFTDCLGDLGSKDARGGIRGVVIAELGELASLNKSDVESVKAFVAAPSDRFREAYGRGERDYPRTVSFIGTTNHPTFLKDPTGNRRWWPVSMSGPIDTDLLTEAMPQILGEAAHRVLNGEQWYVTHTAALEQADEVRAAHFEDDVWTAPALAAAERIVGDYVTIAEILNAMNIRLEQQTMTAQKRIGGILRTNGYQDKRKRINGRLVWVWVRIGIPLLQGGYHRGIPPEARQTAEVPPYPPISPFQNNLVKMQVEEAGDTPRTTSNSEPVSPVISTLCRNKGEQGEQGDTARQTLAKTSVPLQYPPATEGDTAPLSTPVDSIPPVPNVEEF